MSQKINVNTTPGQFMPTLYYSQGDIGREFQIALLSSDGWSIPAGATVEMVATKPSGFGFTVSGTLSDNTATFVTTETMTNEWGRFPAEVRISSSGDVIGTANFYLSGERDPHPEETIDGDAEEIIPELTLLVERVEAAASSVLDMTVVANTLPAGSDATYSYDEETNTATFGIPKGADGSLASGVLAPTYSSSSTYAVGDYVYYSGNLYRCTTAITTAEAWTSGHWTQVALAPEVTDVKSDLSEVDVMTSQMASITNFTEGGYINTAGDIGSTVSLTVTSNGAYAYIVFPVEAGDSFVITGQGGGGSRLWAFLDEDYKLLSHDSANYSPQSDVAVSASSDGYAIFNVYKSVPYSLKKRIVTSGVGEKANTAYTLLGETMHKSGNLLDPTSTEAGAISASGELVVNADYNRSADYVPVVNGATYTSRSVSAYAQYDANKIFIARIETGSTSTPWTFTLPANCYFVKASSNVKTFSWWRLNKGSSLEDEDYGVITLLDSVDIPNCAKAEDKLLPIPSYYHIIGHYERMFLQSLSWASINDYIHERVGSGTLSNGEYLDFSLINDTRDTSTVLRRLAKTNPIKVIDTLSYNLKCVANNAKSGNSIKVMIIGDSTIGSGFIGAQFEKLCEDGGITLTYVGTRNTTAKDSTGTNRTVALEGRSGWSTNDYCYNSSYGGISNPFYNSGFDFSYYMTQTGASAPDWVFIELGINDKERAGDHTTAENLRTMVNSIHTYNSSIKIGVCLVIPPYLGEGKSADAEYNHIFRLNQNDSLITEFKNDTNVYIVPTNAALDARYGFPTTTTAEGDWMTNEVTKPTDQTHPSANGYYQLADMYYAAVVCN